MMKKIAAAVVGMMMMATSFAIDVSRNDDGSLRFKNLNQQQKEVVFGSLEQLQKDGLVLGGVLPFPCDEEYIDVYADENGIATQLNFTLPNEYKIAYCLGNSITEVYAKLALMAASN